jgi:hypothetical protein
MFQTVPRNLDYLDCVSRLEGVAGLSKLLRR